MSSLVTLFKQPLLYLLLSTKKGKTELKYNIMSDLKDSSHESNIKWYHAKTSNIVALCSIIGFFLIIIVLFFVEVPQANQQLMTYLIGSFSTTVIGGAIYYLFQYKKSETNNSNESHE